MHLDVKNQSSHADAPVAEIYRLTQVLLRLFSNRWAGAWHVMADLNDQGFYLALVDDLPEAPGALGYHDVDAEGRPFSKIAVNPSLQNGSSWLNGPYSVVSVVGHEALETVANPIVNLWVDVDQTTETAREVCDAVEDTQFQHDGSDLTNFLLPSWFNAFGKPPYDFIGALTAPFSRTSGGYMIVRTGGVVSQQWGETMPEWRKTAHARARMLGA